MMMQGDISYLPKGEVSNLKDMEIILESFPVPMVRMKLDGSEKAEFISHYFLRLGHWCEPCKLCHLIRMFKVFTN